MDFVKTLTVARKRSDGVIITKTIVGTGPTLDAADKACIESSTCADALESVSPWMRGVDLGLERFKSVAELVAHINNVWLYTTASQYGFALKDA